MKKLIRKAVRFKGITLGLDVHKKFIEYCVLDREGDELDAGRTGSSPEDLKGLLNKLKKRGPLQACLEACGCFVWIFDLLVVELSREVVHVAQPSRIKVVANSMEKNDANDAWWLAYLLYEGRLPESFVAEGALRDLRIAERELRSYTDLRSDLLRRFKSHLAQAGVVVAKNWHASKTGRAKAGVAIAPIQGERKNALKMLLKQIKKLSSQMQYWRARVVQLSSKFPEVSTIKEHMPGFAEVLSATVVGELGSPARYYSEKAYGKATGLTPGYRESGGKSSVTTISRAGSRHARWAYTRAVISCMRCKKGPGVQVRRWVEERSKHKPKRKVIVAAARKLAEGVWRLFAMGEVFDLTKAFPVKCA
jgi:transposase